MGTGTSKKAQVTPVAHISVQPAKTTPLLDRSSHSNASDDTIKKTPSTSSSRQSARRVDSAKRGGISRPLSTVSGRQWSGRGQRMLSGRVERLRSPTSGLPLQRDIENFDLNSSMRSQRVRTVGHLFLEVASPEDDIIFLRMDLNHAVQEHPASCCQLCGNQFTNLGIRVPLLLLCGHSYCSSCLEKACESYDYPAALKCGVCLIVTPLEQMSTDNLAVNEAILDLISSKEYTVISTEKKSESCAECMRTSASQYCSECSACYCDSCGKKAHEGSRVRARHKPVPINLKPRPQPTCKKHPGQSCVLYCETEKQPMCVLCKFYNQHRFHKFEMMSKAASLYSSSVAEKLAKLEELEKELEEASQSLYQGVEQIDSSAKKVQERLEKHFNEMKKSYQAALERREAMLLALIDHQVVIKLEILAEMRLEVAAARAQVLAAKEEASKLLQLNPVSGLLSRRHMDLSFDRALKQTTVSPQFRVQPEVPISLLPDILPGLNQTLSQHGAILQLPPKPQFNGIQVAPNTISLEWEAQDRNTDVSSDRTLTFSLHCYGDIPYKLKRKLTFKKRLSKMITPESGFESELGSESKNTFPSLPPSLLGSRNISLVTQTDKLSNSGGVKENDDTTDQAKILYEEPDGPDSDGLILKPVGSKNVPSLLSEAIRLPKKKEPKLPQFQIQSANTSLNITNPVRLATVNSSRGGGGGGVLNLPPLVISQSDQIQQHEGSLHSVTTSGVFGDSEDDDHVDESDQQKVSQTDSTSSLSNSSTHEELKVTEHTEVGRFCQGYAFEEIYCGEDTGFQYSGLVAGASYFFRVRCHNAAGWGPWSNTVKCMTTLN